MWNFFSWYSFIHVCFHVVSQGEAEELAGEGETEEGSGAPPAEGKSLSILMKKMLIGQDWSRWRRTLKQTVRHC